ncbi:hypothetical protein A33M_1444 [Rhodovulum sp. PH10]|nr:hypothetical protein A33M_1444 [Rhodovulum sp. PH10]
MVCASGRTLARAGTDGRDHLLAKTPGLLQPPAPCRVAGARLRHAGTRSGRDRTGRFDGLCRTP